MTEKNSVTTKLGSSIVFTGYSGISLGGNQAWFESAFLRKKGCGIVSAINISAYLGKYGEKKYESLFGYKDTDKRTCIKVMTEMSEYIRPDPFFGVLPGNYLRGFKAYAADRGVKLSEHIFNMKKGPESMKAFVRNALENDRPLAMLIGYNPGLKEIVLDNERSRNSFVFHWVTVVGLTHDFTDNTDRVRILSWGDSAEIDLDIFYRTFYKALIYFD